MVISTPRGSPGPGARSKEDSRQHVRYQRYNPERQSAKKRVRYILIIVATQPH